MTGPIPSHMALVAITQHGNSKFSWFIAGEFCEHISSGGTIRGFCDKPGRPSWETIRRWLRKNEQFRAQYAHAREEQADALFNEIIDIADDARNDWMERETRNGTITVCDTEAVMRSKLRIDARKWMAGKLRPKVYGDKTETTHRVDVTEAFLTMHKLVSGGKTRELVAA